MTTLIPKYYEGITGSVNRPINQKLSETISVLDFGADPTGVTDSTAAFNAATQATVAWSSALQYNIVVPAGTYKISGTVYVRKGQTFYGTGETSSYINCTTFTNSSVPAFIMGSGLIAGVVTPDSGGQPARMSNLFTLGGPGASSVISVTCSGFSISDMFMSACGGGISIDGGSDGLISNIQIDQALNGIILNASQNISITNFDIYLANYGISVSDNARDIQISNGTIEYALYNSVLFSGATSVQSISFTGVDFVMNTQYTTFTGFVNLAAQNLQALFTGCTFRNMYNYAIVYNTGATLNVSFKGCIFDGNASSPSYTQSTTASVLNAGYGSYNFDGCEFRNLYGPIATINNNLTALNIKGGDVVNCPATRLNINTTQLTPNISIKNVSGFAYINNTSTYQSVVLPFWGGSTVWKVSVKGNPTTSASTVYSAAEEAVYSVTYQYNGSNGLLFADKELIWQTPNRAVPGQLGAVVCFGNVPGGATSESYVASGTICISVTTSSASNFQWYAETEN